MADSPKKPEHQLATQTELRKLWVEHKFDEKIPKCHQQVITVPTKPEDTKHSTLTAKRTEVKYRYPETDQPIAMVLTFTDVFGHESSTIRFLRVGDTIYDAYPRRT